MKLSILHDSGTLKNNIYSSQHTLYDSKHSIFENNVVDAKKVLHKEFGGKKALASYERIKRSAPNVEVLEETLDKQLNTIKDEKFFENDDFDQSQQDREKFEGSIFPDIDTSKGTAVRDVFTAKKLIGKEMMEHLSDVSIQVLQTAPEKLPFINTYLNGVVRSLQAKKQPDSAENLEKISIIIYVDALIHLINCRKRTLENVELSKLSAQVEREVRKKFSMQGNFTNSKFTRQKSIIYYIILLLISTESLKIELEHVLEGVDVSKVELLKYATVVGAKVKDKTTLFIQNANLDTKSQLSAGMPAAKRRRK
jgi:A49-like RNA polymerase I associated factor